MKTFVGGTHVKDFKSLTERCEIEQMLIVPDYYYSLSQHIGAPAIPVVEAGESVKCGQLIAKQNGKVSANIYSSIAGEVVGIEKRKNAQGALVDCIHVRTAEKQETVTLEPIKEMTKQAILDRIALAGIVGLGGAGFPTAVKLCPQNPVDTLIINAAECEPYLNCDNRLLIERCDEVIQGTRLIAEALGVQNIIVGIEANKPEAIEKLAAYTDIQVDVLKKKYPQGAEKTLIYACTKRKVPCGGLPAAVGVVVDNVGTAYAVYQAVVENKPLYSRVMTVSGDGVNTPKNIEVRCGTPLKTIVDFCNGLKDDTIKIISGGPMMGFALSDLNVATTKTDSGLLALTKESASIEQPTPCINCGRCATVCPMHLEPMYIDFYAIAGDYENAVKYGAQNCFECGTCSFVCPAKRPIVQSVRLTKLKMREKK